MTKTTRYPLKHRESGKYRASSGGYCSFAHGDLATADLYDEPTCCDDGDLPGYDVVVEVQLKDKGSVR